MTREDAIAIFLLVTAIVFFFIKFCSAEILNYYIVRADQMSRIEFLSMRALKTEDSFYPLKSRFILEPKNTDYYLLNFEDQDLTPALKPLLNLFLPYQSYEFDGRKMILIVDNSDIFDVNKDWSVETSCPISKGKIKP